MREAACAMECNHIGFIIVQDRRQIVGVVTDRDLALRVLARGLNAEWMRLFDVMTPDPAILSIHGEEQMALELMRRRHVRRIPLVDSGRVVGLVSMDDLVLSGHAGSPEIAEAIRAQLAEPAELKPGGVTHPASSVRAEGSERAQRHAARVAETARHAVHVVQEATGMDDYDRALTALEVVVGGIVRRITPEQGEHLLAQLPTELRARLVALPPGPDRSITRVWIEDDLAQRLDLDTTRSSELALQVGDALRRLVSGGEIARVSAALPQEMRFILWTDGSVSPEGW